MTVLKVTHRLTSNYPQLLGVHDKISYSFIMSCLQDITRQVQQHLSTLRCIDVQSPPPRMAMAISL